MKICDDETSREYDGNPAEKMGNGNLRDQVIPEPNTFEGIGVGIGYLHKADRWYEKIIRGYQ